MARAVVSYDPARQSLAGAASNETVAQVAAATWRAHGLRGFYAGYFAVRHRCETPPLVQPLTLCSSLR